MESELIIGVFMASMFFTSIVAYASYNKIWDY